MNNLTRTILSISAVVVYSTLNTVHEVVSPLISGPLAAQQLTDSNVAYAGAQFASRVFNGAGMSSMLMTLALISVLIAIWYTPVTNLFRSNKG